MPLNLNYLRIAKTNDLIRLGDKADGGYVVNREAINVPLVSVGVGDNWSFEEDYLKYNKKVTVHDDKASTNYFLEQQIKNIYLSPLSPKHIKWIDPLLPFKFRQFIKKVDYRQEYVTALGINEPSFLKLDIEGGEYKVLRNMLHSFQNVTGMVIEFHHLDYAYREWYHVMETLLPFFYVTHVHLTNFKSIDPEIGITTTIEVTFLARRFGRKEEDHRTVTIEDFKPIEGLDYPNI